MKKGCVYKITNTINHLCYIGQSCNFFKRHKSHLRSLKKMSLAKLGTKRSEEIKKKISDTMKKVRAAKRVI